MMQIPDFLLPAHDQYEALITSAALQELFALDDISYYLSFYNRYAPLAKDRFLSSDHPVYIALEELGIHDDEAKLIFFLNSFYYHMSQKYESDQAYFS